MASKATISVISQEEGEDKKKDVNVEGEIDRSVDEAGAATRTRKMTEKGLSYSIEMKVSALRQIHKKLSKLEACVKNDIEETEDYECVRKAYRNWLVVFEEFLEAKDAFHSMLEQCTSTEIPPYKQLVDSLFSMCVAFKGNTEEWLQKRQVLISKVHKGEEVKSTKSHLSVVSAKLAEEQKKAELHAQQATLEKKHELEMKKLEIKMEEEKFNLETQLAISNAKTKVLDQFEAQEYEQSSVDLDQSVKSFPQFRTIADKEIPDTTVPMITENLIPIRTNPRPASDDLLLSVVQQLRKPVPDIKTFSGDPLEYKKFMRQFKTKVVVNSESDDEKMNYLDQFTSGEANRIVKGFGYLDGEKGYPAALKELEERYGDEETIVNAFVKRAMNWPVIKADNPKGLDDFSIFLNECVNAVQSMPAVGVLDYSENIKRLIGKLPYQYQERFRNVVQGTRESGRVVTFKLLADFVRKESKKANDPVFGKEALKKDEREVKGHNKKQTFVPKSKYSFATKQAVGNDCMKQKQNSDNTNKGDVSFCSNLDSGKKVCLFCLSAQHALEHCSKIRAIPYAERLMFLKTRGMCFRCLMKGHISKNCNASISCLHCKGRHQTFLHMAPKPHANDRPITSACADRSHVPECSSDMGARDIDCAMVIVPVIVRKNNSLQAVQTYAFLDPGSSVSFCTNKLMNQLGCSGKKMKITLDTMGDSRTLQTYAIDHLNVCDLNMENSITLPRVYSKDKLPVTKDHIPNATDIACWPHLSDIELQVLDADIGLLIGNNVPEAYCPTDMKTGPPGSPHATKTSLGWVIWNVLRPKEFNQNIGCSAGCSVDLQTNRIEQIAIEELDNCRQLESLLQRSINLDFPESLTDDRKEPSVEDKLFIQKVSQSLEKSEGHYYIGLPFKNEDTQLPDNQKQAKHRLESLRRKFTKNAKFHDDYKAFMNSLLEKGYAERVPDSELERNDRRVWYIPHHGVYHSRKPDKVRVVFDCSAVWEGVSLNNQLLPGPDLMNNLLGILLRFRQEDIAIMGDIECMYYQVRVHQNACDCMRFYWWQDGDTGKDPHVYRMLVHLFGAVSSPSCANFALRQTAIDNQQDFHPEVAETVLKNFYVDDCLSSVKTEEKAISLLHDICDLCQKGGFNVIKWTSNSHKVLESVQNEDRAKGVKDLNLLCDELPSELALGVYWFVETDKFGFQIREKDKPVTRRGLLSIISSVYDPLGFAAPFILTAKILQQHLCSLKLNWDEPIPEKHRNVWFKWLHDLPLLETIEIPRCYKPPEFGEIVDCQIHIFSDASEVGYGVTAYFRLTNAEGKIHCCLILSKSRVAPLKKITIPRMELTAASISVKLYKQMSAELEYSVNKVFFWTDSMSVLRYINNETSRFRTFVANRISVIKDGSDVNQWMYIESSQNPADAASRGLTMQQFKKANYWFQGPNILYKPEAEWQEMDQLPLLISKNDAELRKTATATVVCDSTDIMSRLLSYFSSWAKLKRIVAWILLAKSNLLQRVKQKHRSEEKKPSFDVPKNGQLSCKMLKEAENALIQYVQSQYYSGELKSLVSPGGKIKKTSTAYKLDPFMSEGIVRVGGRLERANIMYDSKHPVLVPKESPIAKMILSDIHHSVGHLGKNAMLCVLRQKYWIPGAGSLIKQLVSRCVLCHKYRARQESQKMSDIPRDRLVPDDPPFTRTGMDYFGPFVVTRGRTQIKRYGVIFTCMSIRAVHLEVASSLDTDSCINSVRRFIARRGTPQVIWSDNGTNLVGCKRELQQEIDNWNQAQIHRTLLQKNVTWNFNPPYGSHHGGIWERLIRSVRKVLYSLLHHVSRLDDENLNTLFCEVEAILNGRPITPNLNQPDDFSPLTPSHLLHLQNNSSLPPGVFDKSDTYAKRRWRQVQYLADVFWSRWVKEYLPLLQERQKWMQPKRNVKTGDIVLMLDNTPRNSWAMGKVVDVFSDKKGFVRSVKVQTQMAKLIRPIDKISLLLEAD